MKTLLRLLAAGTLGWCAGDWIHLKSANPTMTTLAITFSILWLVEVWLGRKNRDKAQTGGK